MIRFFLSASIPLPSRHDRFFETADVIAIRDSVKALVSTVLRDGIIVFGGHPAITPLIALMLRGMPKESKRRVHLFQSQFFENDFPKENEEFIDVRLVPPASDLTSSLQRMRDTMIRSESFDAGIFIGGMEGVLLEYRQFRETHPTAYCYPIASTGAAALELYRESKTSRRDLLHELTYPTLFRRVIQEIGNSA